MTLKAKLLEAVTKTIETCDKNCSLCNMEIVCDILISHGVDLTSECIKRSLED